MKHIQEISNAIAMKYNTELSAQSLQEISSILIFHSLEKGELISEQGMTARDMVYVYSGLLRQYYYKKGRDITEHFTSEGDTLAYCIESLFNKRPAELMMEALEKSIVYTLSYEKLKELSFNYPDIAALHINILETGLVVSQRKADSWRFETARERYFRFAKEYPEVVKRAPVHHIASYLLMSPESLSRIRAGVL